MRTVLYLTVALWSATATAQSIYKWVDEKGQVHYGERPPDSVRANEVALRAAAPAAGTVDQDRQALQRKMLDSFQEERTRKIEQAAEAARVAEQRKINCARARDRLRRVTSAGFVYALDENGERRVYNDAERASSERRAAEAVKQWCP